MDSLKQDMVEGQDWVQFVKKRARAARKAWPGLARLDDGQRSTALEAIAEGLRAESDLILEANALDMRAGEQAQLGSKLDRLLLTGERLEAIEKAVHTVAKLKDPLGEVVYESRRPNGMRVQQLRCPIGVVGMVYEARPNVTVDAIALCLKSGNAVVLKGGSDALHSNRALVGAVHRALEHTMVPADVVQLLDASAREATAAFLGLRGLLDVVIPRGGQGLIRHTQQHARVPVIETGASVVHAYVHHDADIPKTASMLVNGKMRRPSICCALDVALLHKDIATQLISLLPEQLGKHPHQLKILADEHALPLLQPYFPAECLRLLDISKDFDTEFLDYILAVSITDSLEDAISHIRQHSLRHTEAVYTQDDAVARRFMNEVDSACIMHNVSTQFTDGGEFGLGAEMGISTQKLHVRGPFALQGLTSVQWRVYGQGQIR